MPHKLLLADDSVTIQRVIELTFADEDVRVKAVSTGQQAIDEVSSDPPDIVLADVGMPERDGYEVAAFVKGRPELAHIPVLLLTGAFEPVDDARAAAAGCDGVLAKPFEPQILISRVKELLPKAGAPARAGVHAAAAEAAASDECLRNCRRETGTGRRDASVCLFMVVVLFVMFPCGVVPLDAPATVRHQISTGFNPVPRR